VAAWFSSPGAIELSGNANGWSASINDVLSGIVAAFQTETRIGWIIAGFIGASVLLMIVNRVVRS
jgi:uncharacterized membrane protein YeaQ/YmgE (transglycosylase-associated protein family)